MTHEQIKINVRIKSGPYLGTITAIDVSAARCEVKWDTLPATWYSFNGLNICEVYIPDDLS